MQCLQPARKRRHVEADEPLRSTQKRQCLGAELQLEECPMDFTHSPSLTNQEPAQHVCAVVRSTPLHTSCSRCLRGEPGHFNHILGL